MIPFVDLNAQYLSIKSEIDNAINDCISTSSFIKGKAVTDFENSFAKYLNAKYCIGCGNGTDAIEIILTALNIGPGDEVLVPALTWISTAEAVSNVGAEPVFIDVNPVNYTIDHEKIEEKLTKNTRAIIPVHLYGCPADMDEIEQIAKKNNLFIIEDCAQAHGAEYSGKKVGTTGIASAFSFFPSKNMGAFGDGGAVVTNNYEISELVRKIANHGQSILNVKLNYLDQWNKQRQEAAAFYLSSLTLNKNFVLPSIGNNKKHVWHLFVIRCKEREQVIKLLNEKEISWGIHYPIALPFTLPYAYKKHKPVDFINSGSIVKNIISIPIYPEITEEQQIIICEQLLRYCV